MTLVATLVALGPGCKKDPPATGDEGVPPAGSHEEAPARLPVLALESFDAQPGFLASGAIYAAVRAGVAQDFLRQLPLPSDVTRELAEARRELGFDPLTDDVLERFAIPDDAVISMTLGRPIGVEARKQVASELRSRDDRFLRVLSQVMKQTEAEHWGLDPLERTKPVEVPTPVEPVELRPPEPEPIGFAPPSEKPPLPPEPLPVPVEPLPPPEPPPGFEIPPTPVPDPLYDPTPPPVSPGERLEAEALLRKSDAVGLHFRFHIPSKEPRRILEEFRVHADPSDLARGDALCRDHGTAVCLGEGRGLLAGRIEGDAAVLDLVVFTGRFMAEADREAHRAALAEALAAPRAELDALSRMAGHASVYVHAEGLVEMIEHERTGAALRTLTWSDEGQREDLERRLREGESLRRLLSAPRLFDGLLASAHHERTRTQLQVTWPLAEGQQALAESTLVPPPIRVPVPSIEALCEGALICARSRGVPRPEALGTKLGLGVYGDERAFFDALRDADEAGGVLMLVSTWPNALGTLGWHVPLAEARGAEAAMVRGGLDAVGRVQGLGLSLQGFELGRRFELRARYAAYARVPVEDINLVSTALSFAELRMTPTTIEGVEGPVKMLRIPEDDVPAVLMTREDPEPVADEDGKEIRHGWLTLVDETDRFSWLLGRETDDGTEPYAYAEIPDLWRLVATVPEAAGELGFARTWATDRSAKASLELEDGQPRLVIEVVQAPSKAEGS
ncbi:MAG: hypothetical protein KDK70_16190 [Myxococcales bacterium]|nr:hypothetical protein [Myxococcales bacterium]